MYFLQNKLWRPPYIHVDDCVTRNLPVTSRTLVDSRFYWLLHFLLVLKAKIHEEYHFSNKILWCWYSISEFFLNSSDVFDLPETICMYEIKIALSSFHCHELLNLATGKWSHSRFSGDTFVSSSGTLTNNGGEDEDSDQIADDDEDISTTWGNRRWELRWYQTHSPWPLPPTSTITIQTNAISVWMQIKI